MKALVIWLGIAVAVFGTFSVGYHLWRTSHPDRVLVVVDSSFPMETAWSQVPTELDDLDDRRYGEFALVTEKQAVHTWSDELDIGDVTPFAPRDFDLFATDSPYAEFEEATEVILLTNAESSEVEDITDWTVVSIEAD